MGAFYDNTLCSVLSVVQRTVAAVWLVAAARDALMLTLAVTVLSGAAAFSEPRCRASALKRTPTKANQWPLEVLSMVAKLNRRYNAEAALGVFFHTFMGSRHLQVVSQL